MKPIVIMIPSSPRMPEMIIWAEKYLADSACLAEFFAFGTDEDFVLWKMMWSGSHHYVGGHVWVHTESANANFNREKSIRDMLNNLQT